VEEGLLVQLQWPAVKLKKKRPQANTSEKGLSLPAKMMAETKGMAKQSRKNDATLKKKSMVAKGFSAQKPVAKKPTTPPKKDTKAYMAEKRAYSRATAKNKGKY
jgi:hypothetical protein